MLMTATPEVEEGIRANSPTASKHKEERIWNKRNKFTILVALYLTNE